MIGILGAYGNIGRQVISMLDKANEKYSIRCGSRYCNAQCLESEVENLFIENRVVDLFNEKSLEKFIDGCDILINCAGPSNKTTMQIISTCKKKHCFFVDAGIGNANDNLESEDENIVGVYGAGATPGVSGILPLWLNRYTETCESIIFYMGFMGRFTKSAAEDYLDGILATMQNVGAAWDDFKIHTLMLNKESDVKLPLFKNEVTIFPYFDYEAEYVARKAGIKEGKWYIAIESERIANLMRSVRNRYANNPMETVEALCKTSISEMCGRNEYMHFIIQMSSSISDSTKTLLVSSQSPSVLTGATIAATAKEILDGNITKGIRPLVKLENADRIIEQLIQWKVIDVNIVEQDIISLLEEEEGEL